MTPTLYIIYLYIFLFGLVVGSFLNVLIYRSHTEEPWWNGRSFCTTCKKNLTWKELVPVFSYIFQKGRCRGCNNKISLQYPLVELSTAVLSLYLVLQYGLGGQFIILFIIGIFLIGSFVSDLLYMELYEIFMIPAILLSILYQLIYKEVDGQSLIIGVIFGFSFFGIQYLLTRGRGIGAGDLRLGIIMGALLGWPLVLASIMISYVGGSIVSLSLLALGKVNRKSAIPLGVFLIPGLVITFLFKFEITNYLNDYFSSFAYLF